MELPIGISNFDHLVRQRNLLTNDRYLFVDKSLFIREVLSDPCHVILIARPSGFGKTVNLSMLQYFFSAEVKGKCTEDLFADLEVTKHVDCMKHQGQHPVIYLTFKDIKEKTYEDAISGIYEQIRRAYNEHAYILDSNKLTEPEKDFFASILNKTAPVANLKYALYNLSEFLYKHFDKRSYILIDGYDVPIQQSFLYMHNEELIAFIRIMLGQALKDNIYLEKAILMCVVQISSEGLLSDLDNIKIYATADNKYAKYFGFTEAEVDDLYIQRKITDNVVTTAIKEWYRGYQFGDQIIYNSSAIVGALLHFERRTARWLSSGTGDAIIKKLIMSPEPNIKRKLLELIQGNCIDEVIEECLTLGDLNKNLSAIWNLFVMLGYLKPVSVNVVADGTTKLMVPNKEIHFILRKTICNWLAGTRGASWYREFVGNLVAGEIEEFGVKLQILIDEVLSYNDAMRFPHDNFFYGVMLGLVAELGDDYEIKIECESKKAKYNVAFIPYNKNKNGIILGFKGTKDSNKVVSIARVALDDIIKSKYDVLVKQEGTGEEIKLGIGFSPHRVEIFFGKWIKNIEAMQDELEKRGIYNN